MSAPLLGPSPPLVLPTLPTDKSRDLLRQSTEGLQIVYKYSAFTAFRTSAAMVCEPGDRLRHYASQ